jgi:uncharacterized protein YlzI (FlbEa/FlbD family)
LLSVAITLNAFLLENQSTKVKVTLRVFSGTEDPSWFIEGDQLLRLNTLLGANKFEEVPSKRVMGYKGFHLSNENSNHVHRIRGAPSAELFLLASGQNLISQEVQDHVLEQISTSYKLKQSTSENKKFNLFKTKTRQLRSPVDCDATPIRGDDIVPKYDPESDNGGCFIEKQYANNCYDYGTDIVTNTFAQPGRGTGQKWRENTCDDVKRAAISDGLQWIGTKYPSEKPEVGHFIALLIWPKTNFHWVRLDDNNHWSHKPGGTEVRNKDNDELDISDPSTQDFSPWSQFCGYFLVVPSKLTIN